MPFTLGGNHNLAEKTIETPVFLLFPNINDGSQCFSINPKLSNGERLGQARGKRIGQGLAELEWIGVSELIQSQKTGLAEYLLRLAAKGAVVHLNATYFRLDIINSHMPTKLEDVFGDALTFYDYKDRGAFSTQLPMTADQAAQSLERSRNLSYSEFPNTSIGATIDLLDVDMQNWELPPPEVYTPPTEWHPSN